MALQRPARFAACDGGSTALEFALIFPALTGLLVGTLYSGLLLYSAASLNQAVEQAARCYAVNAGECSSESAAQTYARSHYYGVSSPTFAASTASCGHQVSATVSIGLE